ncbi:hypothetical protein VKT23_006246 [Stygiomarasmius scandens]|uniref:Hepcidin n=1 Tax=Marasmiellus scandens TaxID=2682957 RepID=A0ABR1JRL0_9AGAR
MKTSFAFLFSLVIASVNAAAVQKRDDEGINTPTTHSEPMVLTATKVFPSMIEESPYMITVTSEVVWTQYPAPTESVNF